MAVADYVLDASEIIDPSYQACVCCINFDTQSFSVKMLKFFQVSLCGSHVRCPTL